ncbi:SGNH hydrolase-type esterase domain-containing protein [Lasiosphaeria miniovina]|uniref:SGNH hydrolase-type esterase domain-containing protein n=1 Tax=Lasiosphaeria miniovina TaxID=1954250 RepID=A0AA40AKZ5_9PEZI|nr:SGNH hydrolase-type esterase domain-containing protein [Lasiosphaeria miniovina]KAK0717781.1 SGNH hydrolase-type esterase domain-containing protein [Lasiosphaeria miniovina]
MLAAIAAITTVTAQNATLRYMPFGDSITEIICWRSKLWNKLQTTEWAKVDFVGSGKGENNCRDTKYDYNNEGHSGFLAINIANQKQLVGWLQKNPADVITMHLGTNDIVQQNKNIADITAAFTTLVQQMRDHNPRIKIVVAQIIPLGMGNYNSKVQQLNAAIPGWAAQQNKTESPIWVVDQYTGYSGTSDNRDGVHPNDSGDTKMMNIWYPALVKAFEAARADKQQLF